jgi:hypothetical protein
MKNLLIPILVIVAAIALLFIPTYGIIFSIILLGFSPVITAFSNDIIKLEAFEPNRTKLTYFLITAIFPMIYSFFLLSTIFDPELITTLEPLFLGIWSVLLLITFVFYYVLACFLHPAISEKSNGRLIIFIVLYIALAIVQVFSIEISYLFMVLSQP